jgi:phosphatidate cytidylyltransferase
VAIAAVLFLLALWEWLRLADVEDTLARTILLACNAP